MNLEPITFFPFGIAVRKRPALLWICIVMNDNEPQNDDEAADRVTVDEELILELNFVPEWARKAPTQSQYYLDRPERSSRPPSRDRDRNGPRDRRQPERGRRPERDGRKGKGRPERGAPRAPRHAAPPQPRPEPPPPVDVRFLPDQHHLLSVVRKIRTTGRAYPIVELASLFLRNPETCHVRIEVGPDAPDAYILQCGKCGAVAMDGAPLLSHVVDSHLEDYFQKEELLVDPPSGKFVCIARCGLSGTLLGPPNHHSHEAKAREIQRTKYPEMSFAEYQKKIEHLHDEELIAQWKEECRKRTVYRSKESPESEPLTWQEVEAHIDKHVVPNLINRLRKVDLKAAVAREVKHSALRGAVIAAWQRESRFPMNLSNAIRGAFRHREFYVFRAGRGYTFVTATRPVPLDAAAANESISEVLVYLRKHPGCSRSKLLKGLRPDAAEDSPEAKTILSPLHWLAERGHIIEFFDGSLAVPLRGAPPPKHKPKPRHKRRDNKRRRPRT